LRCSSVIVCTATATGPPSLSSCVVDRHSQPAVASVKPARSGAAVHVR